LTNKSKLLAIAIVSALLLTSAACSVKAQGDATVVVLDSVGGTVDPSGTNTYAAGTAVTLTATPMDAQFIFESWLISSDSGNSLSTDNPLTLTVDGGVTYAVQAVFTLVQPPPGNPVLPNMATAAIVVVLSSAGGTTTPAPGTYALEDATSLMLTATPDSDWQFSHWVITGSTTDHGTSPLDLTPTDNPYNVNHGYGNTYYYQAVFTPVGTTEPTPIPEFSSIATVIVALVLVAAAAGTIVYKRKTK
jgi:hypothetical protein